MYLSFGEITYVSYKKCMTLKMTPGYKYLLSLLRMFCTVFNFVKQKTTNMFFKNHISQSNITLFDVLVIHKDTTNYSVRT